MTLSRQLTILISVLVLMLFAGSLMVSVNSTRNYLVQQLASHAQDAATSLGLSATAHFEQEDRAMVTTMVNAMFHRGDYQSIRVEDLDGNRWVDRSLPVDVADVPAWFVNLFALDPPEKEATLMSGWRQVGRVVVRSHPGLAYRKLWQTTSDMLKLFLIGTVLVLAAGLFGLRLLLRPLADVEAQAEAICQREFPINDRIPFTLEFRRVVEAMNRLSARVSRMLEDSQRLADQLRDRAFRDPVTGLANRRQFMDVLEHRVAAPELFDHGGLMLVQLQGFKEINQRHGYVFGDELLASTANCLRDVLADEQNVTIAHLSGADFAIIFEACDVSRLREVGDRILAAVATLPDGLQRSSPHLVHVGGATYTGQGASGLIADADVELREAQHEGANGLSVQDPDLARKAPRAATAWATLIRDAMSQGRFHLLRQPVLAADPGEVLHHELFLRIADPDNPDAELPAAAFLPMAEAQGLAPFVDRHVAERAFKAILQGDYEGPVAINFSPLSLADADLLAWLESELKGHAGLRGQVILELPEYGAVARVDELVTWISRLQPLGAQFSLDHFGKGLSSFEYLRTIKADYLKIDGSLIAHVDDTPDHAFFLRAIADIAHGLDMLVLAESVETDEVWNTVLSLGLDGGQGYGLGMPE